MRLGFVGAGAITEALVCGLVRDAPGDLRVVVSPRSADISARLAARFPATVSVAASNQDVVDVSDVVILAVRPQVAREVLSRLAFRKGQTIVSLVAMLALDDVRQLVAPAERIVRAIPLPSAAEGRSPTVLMPPDAEVRGLLARVGTVTEVADAEAFDALAAASGIMATHFAMAATVASWLENQGVASHEARDYVGQILSGLAMTAAASAGKSFAELVGEHETPGGLNEQLRLHLDRQGAFASLRSGLGLLHRRIRGTD